MFSEDTPDGSNNPGGLVGYFLKKRSGGYAVRDDTSNEGNGVILDQDAKEEDGVVIKDYRLNLDENIARAAPVHVEILHPGSTTAHEDPELDFGGDDADDSDEEPQFEIPRGTELDRPALSSDYYNSADGEGDKRDGDDRNAFWLFAEAMRVMAAASEKMAEEKDRQGGSGFRSRPDAQFDPYDGDGCPQCIWRETPAGKVLVHKCALHQRVEEVVNALDCARGAYDDADRMLDNIRFSMGASDEDDLVAYSRKLVDKVRELEETVSRMMVTIEDSRNKLSYTTVNGRLSDDARDELKRHIKDLVAAAWNSGSATAEPDPNRKIELHTRFTQISKSFEEWLQDF